MNSKRKGNKNEREGAKLFKEWTGFEFSRVPSSGGLRWQRTTDTVGDILCSDKVHYLVFPFSIEMKVRKECDLQKAILSNKNNDFIDFWKQAKSDAERGGKIPMLLARYNRMSSKEYYLGISLEVFNAIKKEIPIKFPFFKLRVSKGDIVVIMNSQDFFKSNYTNVLNILTNGKG